MSQSHFFDTDLSQLRGMTPARLSLLQTELGLFTFGDLIQYYPFRYEDRTKIHPIERMAEKPRIYCREGALRRNCETRGALAL